MVHGLLPDTEALTEYYAGDHLYVHALSVVQLGCGIATLGLVQPWGERIGRLRINRWVPVIIGALGGLAVTILFTVQLPVEIGTGHRPDQYLLHGGAAALMLCAYIPIVLWGPLELVAVWGYHRRRRSE